MTSTKKFLLADSPRKKKLLANKKAPRLILPFAIDVKSLSQFNTFYVNAETLSSREDTINPTFSKSSEESTLIFHEPEFILENISIIEISSC